MEAAHKHVGAHRGREHLRVVDVAAILPVRVLDRPVIVAAVSQDVDMRVRIGVPRADEGRDRVPIVGSNFRVDPVDLLDALLQPHEVAAMAVLLQEPGPLGRCFARSRAAKAGIGLLDNSI
jgi:hypothetical protein